LIPGNGTVADPGLSVVTPGRGEMRIPPVSVCHHVSTIGQRSRPMYFQYQSQASGLIGSPTVPSRRSEERSWRSGYSGPTFTNERMSVGAV
jgi:hypothetical protein